MLVADIDWYELFVPSVPLLETLLRGTVVYLALFGMLRGLMKRESSKVGVTNLLVLVLLADAAQNAMSGDYTSITDGLLLVATILGWSYSLDWLSFRYPFFNRLIKPGKLLLVRNGKVLRNNMRKELITDDELARELRNSGLTELKDVSECYIESNGEITVIPTRAASLLTGRPGRKKNRGDDGAV